MAYGTGRAGAGEKLPRADGGDLSFGTVLNCPAAVYLFRAVFSKTV
jgi:hypothetical protein